MRGAARLVLASLLVLAAQAYKQQPVCDAWPSDEEWQNLRDSLDGPLHGPFGRWDYVKKCMLGEQSNVNVLKSGKGLCMHKMVCANRFCNLLETPSLPAYSVEAHSVADVQAALRFAQENGIGVSIKSSGHSYQGQSTQAGSLLIWMRHFPQDETGVRSDFTDTCGKNHGTTLTVAGGQNFDDTFYNTIGNNHHIVTGSCQTVVLGGGWLLGGGMSFTGRYYGYGVDQVLSFDIVLANGTLVTADACSHPDLYWALRGGGGGSFGVVTSMEYTVHPPTKITTVVFEQGFAFWERWKGQEKRFVESWIRFLVSQAPTLDRRWGGLFGGLTGKLLFVGTREEALASKFVQDWDAWYESTPESSFGRPSELLEEYDGFYDYIGGRESYENPDFDGSAYPIPNSIQDTFSRVIPLQVLEERSDDFVELLVDLIIGGDLPGFSNYLLGGKPTEVAANATAVHPAMRQAILELEVGTARGAKRLREFLSPYLSSVCYNHHSPNEPDIEENAWGDNYARLLDVKRAYDPGRRFNVYHGIDYRDEDYCAQKKDTVNLIFLALLSTKIAFELVKEWFLRVLGL